MTSARGLLLLIGMCVQIFKYSKYVGQKIRRTIFSLKYFILFYISFVEIMIRVWWSKRLVLTQHKRHLVPWKNSKETQRKKGEISMCLKGNRQCQVAKCSFSHPKNIKKFCSVKLDHIHVLTIFPVDKPIQRLFLKIKKIKN